MSLYFLNRYNSVFTVRIKLRPSIPTKTCIVGLTNKQEALKLYEHIKIGEHDKITIDEVDYESELFLQALRLNNLAIMIASRVNIVEQDLLFSGDILDNEHDISDENRKYLDDLYNGKTSREKPFT